MKTATLVVESFSPWCERARWAMDHHRVPYELAFHTPLVGEPGLRYRSRRWRGRVSVPLLAQGGLRLMDSVGIARHAERIGRGAALFPAAHDHGIQCWIAHADRLMCAGRARVLASGADGLKASREVAPKIPLLPGRMQDAALLLAGRYLAGKYRAQASADDWMASALDAIGALQEGLTTGRTYLVGDRLTFADVAMASALQFVRPVADTHMPIGPHTRALWTWLELEDAARPGLAWRDDIYARHRSPGPE